MPLKRQVKLPLDAHFLLFGPRQVGKTTLLRESFPLEKTIYYNLLLSKEYSRLKSKPNLLREELAVVGPEVSHVIIDEIQKVPELLDEVQDLIEDPEYQVFFCLSGSSARKLKKGGANLLGGRAWLRYLFPFTHLELEGKFDLNKVLQLGSLPNVYLNDTERACEILDAYVEIYLEEEIKAETIVRNIGAFIRFLKLAAFESSNILNFSNIARETSTSYKSIKEYFQILEDTLLGFFLLPYAKSTRKKLVKHPKFYLFDNGVRNALIAKHRFKPEEQSSEFGIAFEHFIINEVYRLNKYYKAKLELSFYRSGSGAEVDLIVETTGQKTIAIEIKSKENPSSSDLRGLKSFAEIKKDALLLCCCRCTRKRKLGDVTIVPWQEIFGYIF